MENPVSTLKSNLTPGKIIGWSIVALAVFALADWMGVTSWVLYPVTSFKNKYAASKTS